MNLVSLLEPPIIAVHMHTQCHTEEIFLVEYFTTE